MQTSEGSKKPATITLGFLLSWAFGVVCVLAAVSYLVSQDFIPAVIMLMLSALVLPPIEARVQKQSNIHFSGGVKIVLALIGLTLAAMFSDATPSASGSKSLEAAQPLLQLQSFRVYQEYGFSHIEGEVKNISDKPLENVMAVGSFYDANDNLVKSADALMEYNPILPGQVSPFKVLTTHNPAITQGKVSFKFLLGGSIGTLTK